MRKMRVLMVSSEVEPFAKTGGLGDVVGALPKALKKQGVDVRVIMPKYGSIAQKYKERMEFIGYLYVDLIWRHQYCGVFKLNQDGVTFYFLDNEYYYNRGKLYDDLDLEKFCFLDLAALEVAQYINFRPDIIHIHDWQTGPIAALIKARYNLLTFYRHTKVVYTIHNLQYQGKFQREHVIDMLPLHPSYYGNEPLVNFMKLGIIHADKVTTVSPTYKEEIKTAEYGENLQDLLWQNDDKLVGILNGIDYRLYSPDCDPLLEVCYDHTTYQEGKKKNKELLLQSLGMKNEEERPLVSIISRLATQKGMDLILSSMDDLCRKNINLVLLGSGEKNLEDAFNYFACKYPTQFRAILKFDNALAHKIYAASDLFLMPSVFEPCGLAQMICLNYGTLPLVRSVGGLRDSIIPYNEYEKTGNGFSFNCYRKEDFLHTVDYALSLYGQKEKWNQIIHNGFDCNFSWENSAAKYKEIYQDLIDHK